MSGLSSSDRVLLHLRNYWNVRGELPKAITQDGIAIATNLRRSHIPRVLKRMKRAGLVEERLGHVKSLKRRIKTYFLLEKGFRQAEEILTELMKMNVVIVRESGETEMSLGEACTLLNMKPLEIINQLTPNNMLIMPEYMSEEFLDREKELNQLKKGFDSHAKVISLFGSLGSGKTTLAKKFMRELPDNWRIVWYNLEDKKPGDLFSFFSRYAGIEDPVEPGMLADKLCSVLERTNTIMVFDSYFEVDEELVDFFSDFIKRLEHVEGVKTLFIINESTPSYCRFYKIDSIKSGLVYELHIQGLDEKSSFNLLGIDDITDKNFKRIYLMTKGSPLYIKLIRDQNIIELKKKSRFTYPEIKLMLHYIKERNEKSED